MKKSFVHILSGWLLLAGLFTSCGEDRSGEYYALISSKTWMYEVMQQNYLFYEDLPNEDGLNFFQTPEAFLNSVVSGKDKKNGYTFSHIDSVATRATSDYPCFGFEGAMVRTSGGNYAIRVLYTEKESPAEKAGLKRGDWIIAADGQSIKGTDYTTYIKAPQKSYTFTLGEYKGDNFDTLSTRIVMPQPEYVTINNLLKSSIVSSGTRKAAYLLYNSFGEEDEKELQAALMSLAAEQPNDVILDLRYNPGGYVHTSAALASMLAPAEAIGKTYIDLLFNDKRTEKQTITFDASHQVGGAPYTYENLYILTSPQTASASEAVINGLKPYLKGRIFQVGTATFGKNIGQELYNSEEAPQLDFWLTTFYLANAEGFYDYFDNGLPADYTVEEDLTGKLAELGTADDLLLAPVLTHMETGSFPSLPTEEETQKAFRKNNCTIIYNSISDKPHFTKKSK